MTTALEEKNSRRRFDTHRSLPRVFGEAIKSFSAQTAWSIRQRYKRKNEKQQRNQFISFRKKNVSEKISILCEECDKRFGEYLQYLENELEDLHAIIKEADIPDKIKKKFDQQFIKYVQRQSKTEQRQSQQQPQLQLRQQQQEQQQKSQQQQQQQHQQQQLLQQIKQQQQSQQQQRQLPQQSQPQQPLQSQLQTSLQQTWEIDKKIMENKKGKGKEKKGNKKQKKEKT